jgi:hypothetical protein
VSRLSLSDVLQAQERLIEAQREQIGTLAEMQHEQGATLARILEAVLDRKPVPASESLSLKRGTVGQTPTGVEVNAVPQNGETLEDAAERSRRLYESLAARFPLPSGAAHAAPLGDWPGAE